RWVCFFFGVGSDSCCDAAGRRPPHNELDYSSVPAGQRSCQTKNRRSKKKPAEPVSTPQAFRRQTVGRWRRSRPHRDRQERHAPLPARQEPWWATKPPFTSASKNLNLSSSWLRAGLKPAPTVVL